jgi:WS/DGAT/MGAT family acyltransferase
MLVLLSLTEVRREAAGRSGQSDWEANPLRTLFDETPLSAQSAREHLERVMPEAVKLLTRPAEALRSSSRWLTGSAAVPAFGRLALRLPDPKTRFKGPLGVEKRVAWSRPLPLSQVEALRVTLPGTVNDLLLTAVAGGLRRYLLHKGEKADGLNFRAVVPVSLRPLEEMASLGNQFGLVFLSLPVGLQDPAERLAELRRRMSGLKRSLEPVVVLAVLKAMGMTPHAIQKLVVRIFGMKGTAVMTNVPGPRERLYLAGEAIRGFLFWVPQSGRLGMGISIGSYAGEARLGVATDAGLVADPELIVDFFHEEFEAMARHSAEAVRGSGS